MRELILTLVLIGILAVGIVSVAPMPAKAWDACDKAMGANWENPVYNALCAIEMYLEDEQINDWG